MGLICPESSELGFKIDREHADTHTPRRNRDVQLVEQQLEAIAGWSNRVRSYLLNDLCAVLPFTRCVHHCAQVRVVDAPSLDMGAINAAGVLSPVLPLFEDRQAACPSEGAASGEQAAQLALLAKLNEHQAPDTPLLRSEDVNQLLEGHAAIPRLADGFQRSARAWLASSRSCKACSLTQLPLCHISKRLLRW